MKRFALSALSLALLGMAGLAHAQSSVTLYGVADESIRYFNNAGPGSQVGLASGVLNPSRFGLRGNEDLGGGLKAVFDLEAGYDINNGGETAQNSLFSRISFVGLQSDHYGTLTFGRQYDATVDMVQPLTADGNWGSAWATPGDVDNNDDSVYLNNSVKYVSPVLAGFQFEGTYAFGGVAGYTGSGQAWSAAATYAAGPFALAAGYLRMDNSNPVIGRDGGWNAPTTVPGGNFGGVFNGSINSAYVTSASVGIAQIAASYTSGPLTASLRYSNAQYKPDSASSFDTQQHFNVGGAYVNYQFTTALQAGLGYNYVHASGDSDAAYNQIATGAQYALSKRTTLFAMGVYQRASGKNDAAGNPATASIGSFGIDSANQSQFMATAGIDHKF
ncbi:porin (plasmid) [Burkholderia sp. KK1]|uniref:Gram-negative porin n=1 Tax=Burkholderia sp. M701 TaxID=326454 RepID=V5YNS6_9BURK|nr:porin [Burkholderia sp. M701]AQH06073.1 porin [Burkholderia sp. KK1]BAO18948.1 gram-negative porin [Burkholderia sp. M701]